MGIDEIGHLLLRGITVSRRIGIDACRGNSAKGIVFGIPPFFASLPTLHGVLG
ncbi:hypothetical protein D3C87_2151230 [compost metagenome]